MNRFALAAPLLFAGLMPLAVVPLLIAGCATPASQAPVSLAQVAAIEVSVSEAETLAFQYTSLPPCPLATVCADPALKARIKADGQAAHDAVLTLKRASAAQAPAAYAAVQVILSTLVAETPK